MQQKVTKCVKSLHSIFSTMLQAYRSCFFGYSHQSVEEVLFEIVHMKLAVISCYLRSGISIVVLDDIS